MRRIRVTLVGAIVLGMMAIGASSAMAVTVSPAGPLTASLVSPEGHPYRQFYGRMSLLCSEVALKGNVTAAGAGNFDSIAYTGCSAAIHAPGNPPESTYKEPVTVTPMSGWNFQISKTGNAAPKVAFSNFLLRITETFHPECSIDIGGTWVSETETPSISLFQTGLLTRPSTHLTVTRSSPCARALNMGEVGEPAYGAATLNVSPMLKVTP